MKLSAKFIIVLAFMIPAQVFAQKNEEPQDNASKNDIAKTEKVIANIMANGASELKAVLVDKFAKKMFTVKILGDKVEVLTEFPITYGANLGDKMFRGDNKTPEGIYYITTYRSSDYLLKQYGDYAKIYGAGSFPLNYPNPVDRINNKTGSGIWIHGTDPATNKENTQGCVALRNEDFDILKENVEIKYPVIIADNLTYVTPADYDKEREKLLERFGGFIQAWSGSDYEKFQNHIHEKYKSPAGVKAAKYLENKKILMKLYPKRAVVTNDTKILMKDKNYVVFDTEQFYCAPNILTLGDKKYYFNTAANGELKLISEEFKQKDAAKFIGKEVDKFVNDWALAWEKQNTKKYMDYYSKSFNNKEIGGYEAWNKYKTKLFDLNKKISVKVSDITWTKTGKGYIVKFKQDYSSDKVADKGVKTFILEGCPTQFKIVSETWKAR